MWLRNCAITLGAMAVLGQSAAQGQIPRAMNQYEREATNVVSNWMAAWQSNDRAKMASYLTDDFKFNDASGRTRTGRELYLRCMVNRQIGRIFFKNVSYQAVGDSVYTLVLQRRTDIIPQVPPGNPLGPLLEGNPAGKVGAFFLVKNGKLAAWLDYAIAWEPPAQLSGQGLPAARKGCE